VLGTVHKILLAALTTGCQPGDRQGHRPEHRVVFVDANLGRNAATWAGLAHQVDSNPYPPGAGFVLSAFSRLHRFGAHDILCTERC
jgi:hypothetical protein